MQELVEAYLNDHKTAWAETTLKSESARLKGLLPHLHKTPAEIHKIMIVEGKKPYSIKTAFIRLVALESWLAEQGKTSELKFKAYMRKHRNKFKYAYEKEEITITEVEARERLRRLEGAARDHALGILDTGLRLSESYTAKDGHVVGKGGKPRKVYAKIASVAPRSEFYRQLKAVGLKPHTLRKLCATRLAENGASAADLMKVFGWSNIQTAYQYLQAKDDERLQLLMEKGKEG